MSRGRATIVASLLLIATLGLSASAAQAQDYPGPPPPPAGATCTLDFSASGALLAGVTVNVTLTCNLITAGRAYTGVLNSTPVTLPSTVASANGTITFNNVTLPSDWDTQANHKATLVDAATGQSLGTDTFYVDAAGKVTSAPSSNLPKTGDDSTAPFLKGGAALVALGGVVLVGARRRRSAAAA